MPNRSIYFDSGELEQLNDHASDDDHLTRSGIVRDALSVYFDPRVAMMARGTGDTPTDVIADALDHYFENAVSEQLGA